MEQIKIGKTNNKCHLHWNGYWTPDAKAELAYKDSG